MTPDSRPPAGHAVQLARHLGLFEATMIGVGAMIGAGIFVLTGLAAGQAGPAAVLAFALNGVVTLFTALTYAELSSEIPEAGGGYSFVKKVMPNPVAFISGWMLWFAYVIACSLYAKGFGSYFLEFFHRYVPGMTEGLIGSLGRNGAVALLTVGVGTLFLAINIVGAHASGKTENVITLAKIAILSVFVAFGVAAVAREPGLAASNFSPLFPTGTGGVLAAMGLTFIAFEGYDLIATVSEEVEDPRRTIPRAILYSLGITIVIYVAVVFICLAAVPPDEGLPTWRLLGRYGEIGIVRAAEAFMPRFGVVLVLAGGLFATLSALNATVLASSRVAFSMGRDWMLPNRLSRIHARRKTPVLAITVSGLLFLALAVFLPLETIGTASSLFFLLTFTLVNLALLVYRRRNPSEPRGFRVPLYPLPPVLGILTSAGLAGFQLWHETAAGLLAGGWIALGFVVFVVAFARRARVADVPRVIESPELAALRGTAGYRVLVPLSNPERARPLTEAAAAVASASSGDVMGLSVVELPDVTAYVEAEPFMEGARRVLEEAQDVALQGRVPFSSLLRVGRSAEDEIIRVARESECRLILMGYGLEGDPLEDSLIHHVISEQPCDVAILKTDEPGFGPFRRVLVPVGGREEHDRLKVRLVHALTKRDGPEPADANPPAVTLLTVIAPGAGPIRRRRAEETLRRAAKIFRLPGSERVVEETEQIEEAILRHAGEEDLLLLGLRAEPWLRSFFFGTLAQSVAGRATCPTLLTKSLPPRRKRFLRLQATEP